jgi:hypothetical protein
MPRLVEVRFDDLDVLALVGEPAAVAGAVGRAHADVMTTAVR